MQECLDFKRCPFCGNNEKDKVYTVPIDEEKTGWVVECGGCDANGSVCVTEEEAIRYWNNRR